MARGRNRNNQGANHKNQGSNHPENIDDATDAEFLENDDQVDSELSDEEEQATMANEPSPQDDNEIDESEADTVAASNDVAKKKGNNAVWYGVGAVLVAAAVAGVYYSNQSDDSANNPSVTSQVAEVETAPTDESALTEPEEPDYTKGDVNNDGTVNVQDTLYVMKCVNNTDGFVLTPGTSAFMAADMNGDSTISVIDVLAIMKAYLSA